MAGLASLPPSFPSVKGGGGLGGAPNQQVVSSLPCPWPGVSPGGSKTPQGSQCKTPEETVAATPFH